jgi:hypothetical protein
VVERTLLNIIEIFDPTLHDNRIKTLVPWDECFYSTCCLKPKPAVRLASWKTCSIIGSKLLAIVKQIPEYCDVATAPAVKSVYH